MLLFLGAVAYEEVGVVVQTLLHIGGKPGFLVTRGKEYVFIQVIGYRDPLDFPALGMLPVTVGLVCVILNIEPDLILFRI